MSTKGSLINVDKCGIMYFEKKERSLMNGFWKGAAGVGLALATLNGAEVLAQEPETTSTTVQEAPPSTAPPEILSPPETIVREETTTTTTTLVTESTAENPDVIPRTGDFETVVVVVASGLILAGSGLEIEARKRRAQLLQAIRTK